MSEPLIFLLKLPIAILPAIFLWKRAEKRWREANPHIDTKSSNFSLFGARRYGANRASLTPKEQIFVNVWLIAVLVPHHLIF